MERGEYEKRIAAIQKLPIKMRSGARLALIEEMEER